MYLIYHFCIYGRKWGCFAVGRVVTFWSGFNVTIVKQIDKFSIIFYAQSLFCIEFVQCLKNWKNSSIKPPCSKASFGRNLLIKSSIFCCYNSIQFFQLSKYALIFLMNYWLEKHLPSVVWVWFYVKSSLHCGHTW